MPLCKACHRHFSPRQILSETVQGVHKTACRLSCKVPFVLYGFIKDWIMTKIVVELENTKLNKNSLKSLAVLTR
jgi:hypothetical protein